jgi:surface polysaccharide O-acyltransferase-like enzyme
MNTKIRPAITYLCLIVGLLVAIGGAWFITASMGEQYTGYFHGYLSFNMIIASAALFLILISIPVTRIQNLNNRTIHRLIEWIGQNTLPIYLVHIIVLESLQLGLLGFMPYTYNLLIDVPLLTFLTLVLTASIVYPLKKIPYLTNLIG